MTAETLLRYCTTTEKKRTADEVLSELQADLLPKNQKRVNFVLILESWKIDTKLTRFDGWQLEVTEEERHNILLWWPLCELGSRIRSQTN